MKLIRFLSAMPLVLTVIVLTTLAGCSSLPPQPAMDLTEPGWVIREGQAAWLPKPDATAIRGSLRVAMHWNGRSVVQFNTSTGLLVSAQSTTNEWQVQFAAQNKLVAGRGKASQKYVWLQLPEGLLGNSAEETDWIMTRDRGVPWSFKNDLTGETLEGLLKTTRSPAKHRVQPGEHIIRVVRRYGLTVEALRAVNPGPDLNWFRIGNEINLPEVAPTPSPP